MGRGAGGKPSTPKWSVGLKNDTSGNSCTAAIGEAAWKVSPGLSHKDCKRFLNDWGGGVMKKSEWGTRKQAIRSREE